MKNTWLKKRKQKIVLKITFGRTRVKIHIYGDAGLLLSPILLSMLYKPKALCGNDYIGATPPNSSSNILTKASFFKNIYNIGMARIFFIPTSFIDSIFIRGFCKSSNP